MAKLVKIVGTAVVLSSFAMPLAVADDHDPTNHGTHIECYASITNQCNSTGGCSEEGYNWGLDQCDSIYGQASIQRPPPRRRHVIRIRSRFRLFPPVAHADDVAETVSGAAR